MKNILLPTDFSKNSLNAIHYAVALFKDVPCKFYLLNVFKIPYLTNEELMDNDAGQLAKIEADLYDASQKGLKNLVNNLKEKVASHHDFELLSDYNFFINSVKNYIKERDIDLIIMGTKGATGAKEIFMGSNTGDVIMKANCNVLTIPENATFKMPKEIAFPTDFRIPYKEGDLKQLVDIAKKYQSNIRVLLFENKGYLDEEQKMNKKALKFYFEKIEVSYHTLTNTDFEESLNCFTQSRGNIDMITIIAKHYNFFQRLFFKPKVEALSFHTKLPLLVLHKN
ncbi:MAG: universal stress protein [Flavobacteriaceae bacterium]|nr:universal stress protein [Flavobacteriaceae bacterium]